MPIAAAVFDAYGTLFDVTSAARRAAEEPGFAALSPIWKDLARDWRLKQLEYTWQRAITGDHADFWQVTKGSLDWVLEAHGLTDPELRERLLSLYWELDAFPEVPAMLADLADRGVPAAILSNGTPEMLEAATRSAGIEGLLAHLLSVESVGCFKPHDAVYALAPKSLGLAKDEILFVSSNGWDVAGAAGFGFPTLWVNRQGAPIDRLPGRPDHVAPDLTTLTDLL